MTPLERAARALAADIFPDAWEDLGEGEQSVMRVQARLVIEAIREPSEAMLNNAMRGPGKPTHTLSSGLWVRMIDALLEKGR